MGAVCVLLFLHSCRFIDLAVLSVQSRPESPESSSRVDLSDLYISDLRSDNISTTSGCSVCKFRTTQPPLDFWLNSWGLDGGAESLGFGPRVLLGVYCRVGHLFILMYNLYSLGLDLGCEVRPQVWQAMTAGMISTSVMCSHQFHGFTLKFELEFKALHVTHMQSPNYFRFVDMLIY